MPHTGHDGKNRWTKVHNQRSADKYQIKLTYCFKTSLPKMIQVVFSFMLVRTNQMSEIKRKRRFKSWQVLTSGGFFLLLMIQNVPFGVPITHFQRDDLKLYSMLLDDDIVRTYTMPQYTKNKTRTSQGTSTSPCWL